MIEFLIKGLIRDKSRSRMPIIVAAIGVMLTVFMHAYITGFMGETIEMNAKFNYGHLKVMTQAYAENMDQVPNDLALLGAGERVKELQAMFPEVSWHERIRFGGLIDAPDENGETKGQGAAIGMGIDLLTPGSQEVERLNLEKSITSGRMPQTSGEVLLSGQFADKLGIKPGDAVTLLGSTMDGAMAMYNFTVSGTLHFGVEIMDRGSLVADLSDVRRALQMEDATGEIVGFIKEGFYDNSQAREMASAYNAKFRNDNDEYNPVMKTLSEQGTMGTYVDMTSYWSAALSMVFIFAMSLVLWNAGLLGGLRRYGEVGVRLAMGEEKGHVYKTMLWESVFIGLAASVLGTFLGLFFSWLVQYYGINIEGMMKGAAVMIPTEIRARITPVDYYIGFIPGLISTVLGTALSGIGIFKRQTAMLFKELEA